QDHDAVVDPAVPALELHVRTGLEHGVLRSEATPAPSSAGASLPYSADVLARTADSHSSPRLRRITTRQVREAEQQFFPLAHERARVTRGTPGKVRPRWRVCVRAACATSTTRTR